MEKRAIKSIGRKTLYIVIPIISIVMFSVFLIGCIFIGVHLFKPDCIVKILPYDYIKQYILYDHITYNGVDYYMLDPDLPEHIRKGKFIVEQDCVVLVDADGVPYEEGRTEDVWIFVDDPDVMYLEFNSATYTRNKELALPCYDFED